ncbi:MAG: DUF4157 domain-containing protein [Cyanobacteria bacterium P01_E01_bin.42]
MSRQHQTRTSTRKSAIGQKQPQFTAPPVVQPKAAKKSKERLPEWKPGGSGIASPLARLQQTAAVQTKLTIGQPNDKYEQEADRVARDVVGQINSPVSEAPQQNPDVQMKPQLQLREAVGRGEASTALESEIDRAKSGGQSLDGGLQRSMGQAMGADFSSVKVHTDDRADRLNRSIQARAFTTGPNVFFKRGEYNPGTQSG